MYAVINAYIFYESYKISCLDIPGVNLCTVFDKMCKSVLYQCHVPIRYVWSVHLYAKCVWHRLKVNICKKFNDLMLKQIEKYKLDTLDYQFIDPTYVYI